MSAEFFEYDPLTGISYYTEEGDGSEMILHTVQDLTPLIERNRKIADLGARDKGIKEGWWHYCDIPPIIELQLKKKGINIHDPSHGKAMFKEINENYPYLKLTHKKHVGE